MKKSLSTVNANSTLESLFLEVKKSKITTWAIIDILICFLGRNVSRRSIWHIFDVTILDGRGAKSENQHMDDYRGKNLNPPCHPGPKIARSTKKWHQMKKKNFVFTDQNGLKNTYVRGFFFYVPITSPFDQYCGFLTVLLFFSLFPWGVKFFQRHFSPK